MSTKKGDPLAALDEGLLAHENHRKHNSSKHKRSDMIFSMYFQQVSKSQAATKELGNSFKCPRIQNSEMVDDCEMTSLSS